MIDGVIITPLKQIPDERGKVMHMLRKTDPHFKEFGEVYFSTIFPGVIKGWHLHSRMIINYAVPVGRIKLVLFDAREKSKTKNELQEIFMGPDNYCLVTVPPGVWNGFKGCGTTEAIVCNCSSIVHDPDEITRLDPFDKSIPYDWSLKHR
ncbi:MAG TPA: dTDP-4-dehydrorhamnose 3,5-epimerase family protein [Planctomycetota bacterium]|nr:dTDP-4-dehydrorhamnose 3,5-epimerase family protein [Planctomycetota bacterium]